MVLQQLSNYGVVETPRSAGEWQGAEGGSGKEEARCHMSR